MSTWTHVAGLIRYDDVRCINTGLLSKYKEALGQTFIFEDDEDKWDSCNVPAGSEGSIQWVLRENPDLGSADSYTVSIFGNLRNFNNLDEIETWFKRCVENNDFLVRQAILHAYVEFGESKIWVLSVNSDGTKRVKLASKTEAEA